MSEPRRCNLCGREEGRFHAVGCVHFTAAEAHQATCPDFIPRGVVEFGPNGLVCVARCRICLTSIEEGGLCKCPPKPTQASTYKTIIGQVINGSISDAQDSVTYNKPPLVHHEEARVVTAATDAASILCPKCRAPVLSTRLSHPACGYRGDL